MGLLRLPSMPAISQNRRTPHCDAIGKVVYFPDRGQGVDFLSLPTSAISYCSAIVM